MAASKPSNDLKNKTNANAVGTRSQEATAEDFQEIGAIFDNHANLIDAVTGGATPNPFYGVFISLGALQAAYPIATVGAYANIDVGVGTEAQIAIWNDGGQIWEIKGEENKFGKWYAIEDYFMEKGVGNSDNGTLQIGDEAYYRKITNSGDPLTLNGQEYIGGNEQLRSSYSMNQSIDQ